METGSNRFLQRFSKNRQARVQQQRSQHCTPAKTRVTRITQKAHPHAHTACLAQPQCLSERTPSPHPPAPHNSPAKSALPPHHANERAHHSHNKIKPRPPRHPGHPRSKFPLRSTSCCRTTRTNMHTTDGTRSSPNPLTLRPRRRHRQHRQDKTASKP